MEFLNIKEKDLSIIIPLKNGHTLLYTTFIHLFKHLNIEVKFENEPNKVLSNSYIFVRNPIDRFFSSYFWLEYMSKIGDEGYRDGIINCMELTRVSNIDSYIRNYSNFINKCNDFHYIPQSSQILYNDKKILKEEIIDTQFDLKSLYEYKFGLNYNIFKIEEINKNIKKNTSSLIDKNIGFDDKSNSIGFNMDKFSFLEDFSSEVSFLFTTFYSYFKNIYESTTHHKNIDYVNKITLYEYDMVCKITKNEYDFFEYDKKVIDCKLFKKNMI